MARRMGRGPYRGRRATVTPEMLGLEQTEKSIERDIIRALKQVGFHVDKLSQPRATMQTEGIPDLHATHVAWGIADLWCEVKRPGETPRASQVEWHERVRAAGGCVIVATSASEALEQVNAIRAARRGNREAM